MTGDVPDRVRLPDHRPRPAKGGQTLLIRGGTSTVGLRAATMAEEIGATVISTTRYADRAEVLPTVGVDHPVVDDGHLAEKIRALMPQGVDGALELVGCSVLTETLRTVRRHGTVCFTGAPAGQCGRSPPSPRS